MSDRAGHSCGAFLRTRVIDKCDNNNNNNNNNNFDDVDVPFSFSDSFLFAVDYYQSDVNVYADIADIAETLDLSVYSNCHPIFVRNPERQEYLLRLKETNTGVLGVSVVIVVICHFRSCFIVDVV